MHHVVLIGIFVAASLVCFAIGSAIGKSRYHKHLAGLTNKERRRVFATRPDCSDCRESSCNGCSQAGVSANE